MYKKIISVMSVALVVFLCSFPTYAVTGGGKTIVSNSYSYNNGDVTVYVRVNGNAAEDLYEGQHYYPHNFTVTLANNTNQFQVADASNFSIDLYSGSSTAFASNQNSWGSEVTSYSDNMTIPRVTMYSSGDLAGHVLVAFNDSDLLVLNPNETRTYNFSVNFIQTENVNYTPLNGNFRYSYFTYTGTVGFYARPTSFSGNTIEDFINNNSLPNSVIAWEIAQYNQGIITNDELTNILNAISYTGSYAPYTPTSYNSDTRSYTNNGVSILSYAYRSPRLIVDNSIYYNPYNDTYNNNYSYQYQYNYYIRFINTNNYPVKLSSFMSYTNINENFTISNYIFSGDIIRVTPNTINIIDIIVPANGFLSFYMDGYSYHVDNNLGTNPGISALLQINGNFTEYDPNNTINSTEEQVHQQEQNYYTNTNTAISNTGLDQFSFSQQESGGLSGVSNDFVRVWNACGSLNSIWVFALTLSLALYIIHHVPRQRSQ